MGNPTCQIVTVSLFAGLFGIRMGAEQVAPDLADNLSGFEELEVEIPNESRRLSGTLKLPSASGLHPCVLLLAGSGAQARRC